jgi:hypothetical protein
VNSPVLLVLDQNSGAIADPLTVRPAQGRDWYVTDAAVSSDERYLAVSYHGPDTSGADWISLSDPPQVCSDRTPAYLACVRLHGDVAFAPAARYPPGAHWVPGDANAAADCAHEKDLQMHTFSEAG